MIIDFYKRGNGGSGYTLPIASQSTLGGIMVGDGLDIDANGVLSSDGIDSGAVETQILSHNYVNSGEVETQISEKNYTTSGEVETQIEEKNYTTSAAVETQITDKNYTTSADVETQITNKNYITSAQGATVFASQEDMSFISGRTQANERVLAEAVADLGNAVAKFSAYTPTSDFATINGSVITEGGDISDFDSDRVKMSDRTNGDWNNFEDNMCGMGVIPLGYAKGEVVLSKIGVDYNIDDCLWRIWDDQSDRFNEAGIYIVDDGESNPIMQLTCGEDTIDLDMTTEGTSAYTINAGIDNPDDYIWHIDQTNEYKDIDGSSELVAVITMKIYDANNDRYLGIAPEGYFSEDSVYVGEDSIQPEVADVAFAQAKRWFDEEAGEDKGKWVKYYNEENIKELNLVSSTDIKRIVKITQSDYDNLVNDGLVDSETWYLITNGGN